VTLRDPECRAQSNNSHFLLAFPVTSCGTEAVLQGHPRGVEYKNTVRRYYWAAAASGELTDQCGGVRGVRGCGGGGGGGGCGGMVVGLSDVCPHSYNRLFII